MNAERMTLANSAWLLLAISLLWPADVLIMDYYHAHSALSYLHLQTDHGLIHIWGFWEDLARLSLPITGLALLFASGLVSRRDIGLTLAVPARTLWWSIIPAAVCAAATTAFLVGVTPFLLLEKYNLLGFYDRGEIWSLLWHACLMAPLVEEPLYRAMPVAALDRIGGRWFAYLGAGVIWAALHWGYGLPIWLAPFYFVASIVTTWVFLRSGSLLPPMVLHSTFNLTLVIFWYVAVLA